MENPPDLEKKAMGTALQVVTIAQSLNQELHSEIQKSRTSHKTHTPSTVLSLILFITDFIYFGGGTHIYSFQKQKTSSMHSLKSNLSLQ